MPDALPTDLRGQTVVVTGAGGRLGRVLVQHLLQAGAAVAGVDAAALDADGDRYHTFTADLVDERAVEEVFGRIAERLGGFDAVVHTVGMWAGQPLAETSLADWRQALDVNLTSAFLAFRAGARHWAAKGREGRLVALASKQGADAGVAEQAAYSAGKAGVVRLVEATARELGPQGVTAAAVAPSMILFGGEDAGTDGVPVARVAALCAYLASPAGAAHNGAVLRAYGTML